MQDKIIEIIVSILNEIRDGAQIDEIDLKKLICSGYTETEINGAFAWIFSKVESGKKLFEDPFAESKSHRFFHLTEKNIFTTDAMGYLIQMKELGVISDLDEELIIDKVFMSGYQKAGVEEVKIIISSVLFDFEDKDNPIARMVLNSNDTVH